MNSTGPMQLCSGKEYLSLAVIAKDIWPSLELELLDLWFRERKALSHVARSLHKRIDRVDKRLYAAQVPIITHGSRPKCTRR